MQTMSVQEFNDLLQYVKDHNVVGAANRVSGTPNIKRLTPYIDVLDLKVYRIDFTRVDSTVNTFESRALKKEDGSFYEQCVAWLSSPAKLDKNNDNRTAVHNRRRKSKEPLLPANASPWTAPAIFTK